MIPVFLDIRLPRFQAGGRKAHDSSFNGISIEFRFLANKKVLWHNSEEYKEKRTKGKD
jgi:hypothetical protein